MPVALRGSLPSGFTTRFAPAPTGHLHLGHVVSAIWVWGLARAHGGRVLLRIEDHDAGRCRPEFETSNLDDLDWLGFAPDNGGTAAFRQGTSPFRQGDRHARYEGVLADLERRGLAYPCECSRKDIAAAGTEGDELRYPGTCRTRGIDPRLTSARRVIVGPGPERFADLRAGPQTQVPDEQCGDFLLRDRSGNFTYQFCNVVDDLDQGVDVVIRGEDLLASTGRQLRLAKILGRTTWPRYLHHPLVRRPDGSKLSKSDGATGIRELRAAKESPERVLGLAAQLAGVHERGTPISATEVAALFA